MLTSKILPRETRELVDKYAPHMDEKSWQHVRKTLASGVGLHSKQEGTTSPHEPPIEENNHKEHVIHHIMTGAHNMHKLGKASLDARQPSDGDWKSVKDKLGKSTADDSPGTEHTFTAEELAGRLKAGIPQDKKKKKDAFSASKAPGKEGSVAHEESTAREAKRKSEGKEPTVTRAQRRAEAAYNRDERFKREQAHPEIAKEREQFKSPVAIEVHDMINSQEKDQDIDGNIFPNIDFSDLNNFKAKHSHADDEAWKEAAHPLRRPLDWQPARRDGSQSSRTRPGEHGGKRSKQCRQAYPSVY